MEGSCVHFGVVHQERVPMLALWGLRAPRFTFSAFSAQEPPPPLFFSFFLSQGALGVALGNGGACS